jgi:rhamnogalacturonyl hydrolase YesR
MRMKKVIAIVFMLFIIAVNTSYSQNEPVNYSEMVARSFIKRFPDPDTIHWTGEKNHFSWQAGYIMFAMEKMWKATGDKAYLDYIRRYVDQQVDELGNVPDFKNNALDNFLPGYAILFMYEQTHLEKYKIAATTIRHGFDNYPRTSDGMFWHAGWAKNQAWVDGVFMGQIFLARYGKTIGDSEYAFNEAVKQITLAAKHCQKENGLLLHGWDDSRSAQWADKKTGNAPEVWSEGLGWYAVLLADIFDYLPKEHPGYSKVLEIHRRLCRGIKEAQDPRTGMWCQVVDKCNEPGNWNEASGTGMFIYLLNNSAKKGLIDKKEYLPVVQKAFSGLKTKAITNKNGFIDLIDCSSIGIQKDYTAYISQPHEVSTFAAFGSFIIGTASIEFQ